MKHLISQNATIHLLFNNNALLFTYCLESMFVSTHNEGTTFITLAAYSQYGSEPFSIVSIIVWCLIPLQVS